MGVLSLHRTLMACPKTEKPLPHRPGYTEENRTELQDARARAQIPLQPHELHELRPRTVRTWLSEFLLSLLLRIPVS